MTLISNQKELLSLFSKLNCGGVSQYDDENQALEFVLDSLGGEMEEYTLTLRFVFVEYFHLPLSLDACSIKGFGIDKLIEANEEEARQVMPEESWSALDYNRTEYRCFRFYANEKPSSFYLSLIHI